MPTSPPVLRFRALRLAVDSVVLEIATLNEVRSFLFPLGLSFEATQVTAKYVAAHWAADEVEAMFTMLRQFEGLDAPLKQFRAFTGFIVAIENLGGEVR